MKYKFELAKLNDAKAIADIEHEHFEEGIAYTEVFIRSWMQHNPEMFWVVRDQNGTVVAHTILVPVTSECYNKLHNNEVHDMLDFSKADVLQTKNSDNYYTASIAIKKEFKGKLGVFHELISEIVCYFYEYGKRIITTPITAEGLSVTKTLGYKAINGVDATHNNYEVIIDDELVQRHKKILKRKKRIE